MNSKKIKGAILLFAVPMALLFSQIAEAASSSSTATLYYSNSCSHCREVLNYLKGKNLSVVKKNISNSTARNEMKRQGHYQVPVLIDGNKSFVGSSQIIGHLKKIEGVQ